MQRKHTKSLDANAALSIVKELDRALAMHQHWIKDFYRFIICGESAPHSCVNQDAHLQCDFGRWYSSLNAETFLQAPDVKKIDAPHKAMHDSARELLESLPLGNEARKTSYLDFVGDSLDFKQAIHHCQSELLQRVCTVDHLTGAWTRHTMESRLREEAERVSRGSQPCVICMIDIDHFKTVNDLYGHPAGDRALSTVARFLMENLRIYDITFRYGGEEFLVCLPDTQLAEAEQLLNRLRVELSDYPIQITEVKTITISASFGIASLNAGELVADVIERADHALLSAKSQGRNCVCVWDIEPISCLNR